MLYDKRWDKQLEIRPDPLSLAGLIAWLETQPADKKYNWSDCEGGCLIDQYGTAVGHLHIGASGIKLHKIFGKGDGYGKVCSNLSEPTTFGAALERARKLAASS